jgi:hypothetical protein
MTTKKKRTEALQEAEDMAVLHRLYCTSFRSVRQCYPLDQSNHECNPIDCFFIHLRQRYVCLCSGISHACINKDCHQLIHQEENVRCGITGRIVETYNLDAQPPRQFEDDEMEEESHQPSAFDETFRTSRLESASSAPSSVRFQQINLQVKRKLQEERGIIVNTTTTEQGDDDEEKNELKEARKSYMKEAARQRVGVVWTELCDQFVSSRDVKDKTLQWRSAMIALWDLYEWAREHIAGAYASVAPHDFVLVVACSILHVKPFSLLGDRIRLGAISHHIRLPPPLSNNKFEMRLRHSQISLSSRPIVVEREATTNDAAVARRFRQLRLQDDDIRQAVEKQWSSKTTVVTTIKTSFHKTSAAIRRALDRASDICPPAVLDSLVVHLRVS